MFKGQRREKKPEKKPPANTKKAVTSSLIMTVVALSLCFGILIGGIDSNTDITDIFINEPDNIHETDEGNVPVSYDNGEITAVFDLSDENNIKLSYYDSDNNKKREIDFTFDSNARLTEIYEDASGTNRDGSSEKKKPGPEKSANGLNTKTPGENGNIIPICEFEYDSSSVTRRREYKNGKLYKTVKTTVTENRDSSSKTKNETYSSTAEFLGSVEYTEDRYGNPTFYASYNKNNVQISGFSRSYTYDSNGNITSSSVADYGREAIECVYRYDERNNLVYSSTFDKDLATAVTTYAYVYDSKSRISEATKSVTYSTSDKSAVTNEKYEYDGDNLISKTTLDSSGHTLFKGSYAYSASNKLIRSTETDSAGERTVTLGYENVSNSLYEKMQTITGCWDVFAGEIKS